MFEKIRDFNIKNRKMKNILIIASVLALFFSCSQVPQYKITGVVNDSIESTIYLMQHVDGERIAVDSAQLVDGKFEMIGAVEIAQEYFLKKGDRDMIMLFVDNVAISVKSESDALKDAKVEGGEIQTTYNAYLEKYNRLYGVMMEKYQTARAEKDEQKRSAMMEEVDALYKNVELFQEVYVKENSSSPVASFLLTRLQYGKSAAELDSMLQILDVSLINLNSYKSIEKRIEALKSVAFGAIAPDFTQNDADGNPITFSDIYKANKVTLVDFWASWCGPCRGENPNVVEAFKKYNEKGFTVFGVSLDSNKERWLKAIEDDHLTWEHVSDLAGWGNAASKKYAVNSIPASFLVNQDGKIIGANLRGEDLHKKLAELLD